MKQIHAVHDGKVFCPVQRRAVDVVTCYGCEQLLDIDLDSRQPRVTCEVASLDEVQRSA